MKRIKVSAINNSIAANKGSFIEDGEKTYNDQLTLIANKLRDSAKEKPIVLLSGPSGSGKTTSALRIEKLLCDMGYNTHTISMDNYFRPVSEVSHYVDEDGKVDFESPYMMNIELFQKHMGMISRGEEITIPQFNFMEQTVSDGRKLLCKPGELVIFEGIHALNTLVTGDCDSFSTRMYVSVRTRIENDNGDLLHPSKIRLMRRLMRDKLFRGRDLERTFEFFKSVERGESKYIMPFKDRAEYDVDTFITYEASVYRDLLLPELEKTKDSYKSYSDYSDIEKFLKELAPLESEIVPDKSLVREFIGGSRLTY